MFVKSKTKLSLHFYSPICLLKNLLKYATQPEFYDILQVRLVKDCPISYLCLSAPAQGKVIRFVHGRTLQGNVCLCMHGVAISCMQLLWLCN